MSYCLNPSCKNPLNQDGTSFCLTCGAKLLLENRYNPSKFIGAGGMGRNFLAVDERTPKKKRCVIKQFFPAPEVVNNPTAYQKAVQLFNTEATMLDALGDKSTQIPRLLAYIEQGTSIYFVQEFIDGQNLLQQLTQNGNYSESQIFQLLNSLLPVLQFIHTQGVIHRDIKPENIMYHNNQFVLIDFGISKELSNTVMTMGTIVGTTGYAPPEQIIYGDSYPASDIYALGATCIHLLTGIFPNLLYDSQERRWIWQDVLMEQGVTISSHLTYILDKMLQEDIQRRYKSVKDILYDLQHRQTVVTTVLPPPRLNQAKKLKIPLIISIAVTMFGIGGYTMLRQFLKGAESPQISSFSLPPGNYHESCSNLRLLSNFVSTELVAECKNIRGELTPTKLPEYYKCKPNTIINKDGQLTCTR
jgi:serine/threonine protein kinase